METETPTEATSTSLVKADQRAQHALEPSTLADAITLSGFLFKSGLLPRGITKPEAALAVMISGRELGLTAMQSLRAIHIIEGKISLSADLMVACVKRSPNCRYFRLVESSDRIATYETERAGEGVTRMSFTIEMAREAGVTNKDNWRKYPAAMLRARCAASLARAVYPDLLMGFYDPDELSASQPETVPVRVEAVVVEPPAPPIAAAEEESIEAKILRWSAQLEQADTMAKLDEVAAEIRPFIEGNKKLKSQLAAIKAKQVERINKKSTEAILQIAKDMGGELLPPGQAHKAEGK